MYVLTASQMQAADRAAIAAGFPSLLLMENAAYALLRHLERTFPDLARQRIAIFCGKGNNGADGLALARLLQIHHRPPALRIYCPFSPDQLSPDGHAQLPMLSALGLTVEPSFALDLAATTLAIDALLGTGTAGPPRAPLASWIETINALPLAHRCAVDTPSGLGSPLAVRADSTVTFAAPKLDQVLAEDPASLGQFTIAPIGIPDAFLRAAVHLTEPSDFAPALGPRARNSHKGFHGHVAILGGASGKNGALNLAGLAALRAGAGFVTLYSPDPTFRPHLPDLMHSPWSPDLSRATVLAIGPGLGLHHNLDLHADPRPQVLDADALNQSAPWTQVVPPGLTRILTPHPKEMSRLLGRPLADPLTDATHFAQQFGVTLVLKSHRTLIAFPDGEVWINPTGSPALAKAGSGDILTGMLAALLSQTPAHPRAATLAAVYLHGLCGELAATHEHERCSTASGLLAYLPEAFRRAA
ncbi:MAG: NAD(P)H-hydrate dehydratase [Bryobacter sp.]|nr:NAD(P)H-hydrate dehydratase [Bryobacter sp.]